MNDSIQYQNQFTQARFGWQVAAYLSAAADDLSCQVKERLRAARAQALNKHRVKICAETTKTT
jgi:hypothetical protein